MKLILLSVLSVIAYGMSSTHVAGAQLGNGTYQFSYEFQSGGILTGTFTGHPAKGTGSVFDDTIVFLPFPATATYADISGFTFMWDTSLATHSSSQVSLISGGENAFVSLDGSKMDLALAAGSTTLFLENGVQGPVGNRKNNASTANLLLNDLSEPFLPGNWILVRVPEPKGMALLICAFAVALTRKRRWAICH